MHKNKTILILAGILLLTLLLRVFKLGSLPMYGDELTMVEDSYSLLKTGLDQTGAKLPLTFSMGAGRPAGYVYFSIPFVAVFGPTAWGVRALSVLSSVGIVLIAFLLTKKLFSEKTALITAFLISISPWDLSLGRGGFEAHFALFLALLGTHFLLNMDKRKINLLWATLSWGLAVNTYPTFKLILPLFLLLVAWYIGGIKRFFEGKKWITALSIFCALIIITVTVAQTFVGGSENRFKNINVFESSRWAVEQNVILNRTVSLGNGILGKIFYNKPLSYFKLLTNSYLEDFSLQYLAISGDGNPRHNMASVGIVWMVEIFTIALGLKYLIDNKEKRKELIFIASWLLIAPLASIFTLENHGLRTDFMMYPLSVFSGLGIVKIFESKKKFLIGTVVAVWLLQFIPAVEQIYFLAPYRFAKFWSGIAKVIAIDTYKTRSDFDYTIISTELNDVEYAYPVYNKIDPREVISNNQKRTEMNGVSFKKFGNVYFGVIQEDKLFAFLQQLPGRVKYIGPYTELALFKNQNDMKVLYEADLVPTAVVYEK